MNKARFSIIPLVVETMCAYINEIKLMIVLKLIYFIDFILKNTDFLRH